MYKKTKGKGRRDGKRCSSYLILACIIGKEVFSASVFHYYDSTRGKKSKDWILI